LRWWPKSRCVPIDVWILLKTRLYVIFRFRGLEADEARVKEHTEKFGMKLDGYEAILSKQKYLAGDVSPSACELPPAFG
jgi:hypothetical protein